MTSGSQHQFLAARSVHSSAVSSGRESARASKKTLAAGLGSQRSRPAAGAGSHSGVSSVLRNWWRPPQPNAPPVRDWTSAMRIRNRGSLGMASRSGSAIERPRRLFGPAISLLDKRQPLWLGGNFVQRQDVGRGAARRLRRRVDRTPSFRRAGDLGHRGPFRDRPALGAGAHLGLARSTIVPAIRVRRPRWPSIPAGSRDRPAPGRPDQDHRIHEPTNAQPAKWRLSDARDDPESR